MSDKNDIKFIKEARALYEIDKTHWQPIYNIAEEDLYFLSDAPDAQWNPQAYQSRVESGRPAVTADKLGQFTRQVANQIKMNTPSINVIPSDDDASVETADILKGLIKNIEYRSNADDAYDNAVLSAIRCSIGFIKVEHDYVDDESFEQELIIKRVVNPLSCYMDSRSILTDGSDAKHAFILENILVKDFKVRFKNANPVNFVEDNNKEEVGDEDYITIAEYFKIVEKEVDTVLLENGEKVPYSDEIEKSTIANRRMIKEKFIKRCMISGEAILEETEFAGKYIPLVPVYGDEMWLKGKRKLFSLIRKAKEPQRLHNFWKTLETELLMKAPKAPWVAAEGTTEAHAEDWLNPEKSEVLRYSQTDSQGNPAPAPQRVQPPPAPIGIINASQGTVDDIKSATGMYNASLGQTSNETSGIAIQRRKQEGEVGTYHFADNLSKSITHVGQILINAIPEVYDTQRTVGVIDDEDTPEIIGVNGKRMKEQEEDYDLTSGKYDVRVVTGNSFTTMRQESAEFFNQVVQNRPELMEVMGDLAFKYMDIPGAEAMSKRMEKAIDPKYLEPEDGEEQDPEKLQMAEVIEQGQQALMQMQEQLQVASKQLEDKDKELNIKLLAEQNKAKANEDKNQIELLKFKLESQDTNFDNEMSVREFQLKEKQLEQQAEIEALKVLGSLKDEPQGIVPEEGQSLDNFVNVEESE